MTLPSAKSYGPKVDSEEAYSFLLRLFSASADEVPPVCLWGRHGIGKTELVKTIAQEQGWKFVTISPAQFEEMGDLIGLPFLDKNEATGKTSSRFAPPEWVPQEKGPGILLIDDFNRADDRILRGLMALWQERKLSSWTLPSGWFMVLTANPEGDLYSVTPVDEASLTRMLHLELQFNVQAWVNWAQGQDLPNTAIDFVSQHPEVIDGLKTTPRTLTYFFRLWRQYGQPGLDDPQLRLLLESAVTPRATKQFMDFLQKSDWNLPDAQELLTQPLTQTKDLFQKILAETPVRTDLINLLFSRLSSYVETQSQLPANQEERLAEILLIPELPSEHVLLFLHGLSASQHSALGRLLQHPALSQLLLAQ